MSEEDWKEHPEEWRVLLNALDIITTKVRELQKKVASLEEDRDKTLEALEKITDILSDHMDRVQ